MRRVVLSYVSLIFIFDEKIRPGTQCDLFYMFFFGPMPPPHVLVDFVVLPPGHGSSVTDF